MGLYIGGVVNPSEENSKPAPKPQPQPPKQKQTTQAVNSLAEIRKTVASSEPIEQLPRARNRNVAPAHPRMEINPDDHLVVVDGKAKKIGKQSKYLLDMLTIEE